MQKITTFLWFDTQAKEAAEFYVSTFKNSKINIVTNYGEGAPGPKGSVMTVAFELDGQNFTALNGGPQFQFTPAISLVVNCATQDEIDEYWEKLSAGGGQKGQCGWLTDKYGLSWQVVPNNIGKIFQDAAADPAKSKRIMDALMKMTKLDIKQLQNA